MAIEKIEFGNHFIIYDNDASNILGLELNLKYKTDYQLVTEKILGLKDSFKQRGYKVIKPHLKRYWDKFVDDTLENTNDIWYNGASLEASLVCMERLSAGNSIEESYLPIDINNPKRCVHLGVELSRWQNYSVAYTVGFYHERGIDFCNYRNESIRNNNKIKKLTI